MASLSMRQVATRQGCQSRSAVVAATAIPHLGDSKRWMHARGRSYDAVIIGGGLLGSSVALELRRAGFSTLNIDGNPSPGYGSTSSSSSMVRHFYSLEASCRLAWEGYHYWKHWPDYMQAPVGDELCCLHEVGCAAIDTRASEACTTYISKTRQAMEACNIPVEYWDVKEIERRLPYVSTRSYAPPRKIHDDSFGEENGPLAGLLFCPQAGYVNDPQLAARNLAEAAMRNGAKFQWNMKVREVNLNASGSRVSGVTLEDDTIIDCGVVVNAAGPHSQAIHDMAFTKASVEDDSLIRSKPLRVEVAYVNGPRGVDLDSTLPGVADMDCGIYFRPQAGGQVLIGSAEPECDTLHFLNSADELKEGLTDEWTNLVYRAALRLPGLEIPNTTSGLSALYDATPDWVPIYDRTSLGGFYSLRGTSGNQFKNGPVIGRIGATLIENCENGHDHDNDPLLLPFQYASGSLELGMFSRRRENLTTSGTVFG
mmetsp:Transcript_10124/g.22417  ORF Transcript_10124/g.22417 Transcript_10124/m.22417 type:complete len:483 (-) Transcript_10124:244-1692(-)|eukprot:CAMPEP_0206468628 /NCGR_PEP_ID=MMETSP0324_2-20121206/29750_1 /ASSEMBLY_ACC=CAM_ASM_000836 /TAXON_ID=2866 /ORGANISM="Crypthecodinium cohnii, Strain Seligo" /LENGTH=482 /DNA_ID=CAMNT_0053942137 /DNA_START=74 /DNA_END=1522 /DNA_ORIENTATION=+